MEKTQIKLEALKIALQIMNQVQAPSAMSLVKEAKIIETYLTEK